MTRTMTGGCQCGRIRYEVDVEDDTASLCHCGQCRRATGGIAAALKDVPIDAVRFATEPDWYRSSPIAERPFCSRCGTPLGFRFVENATRMDLTIGSFDEPVWFRPTINHSVETAAAAWQDTRHLQAVRIDENPSVRDRWIAACGKLPE